MAPSSARSTSEVNSIRPLHPAIHDSVVYKYFTFTLVSFLVLSRMFKTASHKLLPTAITSRSAQSFSAFYAVSVAHPPPSVSSQRRSWVHILTFTANRQ
jgi:hypothetical protein